MSSSEYRKEERVAPPLPYLGEVRMCPRMVMLYLTAGMPAREAAVGAALVRIRPVLMTALTTMFGLVPLLLSTGVGSEIQRPLATVVVGGLVTSTLLTLLVLPAIYPWFDKEVSR